MPKPTIKEKKITVTLMLPPKIKKALDEFSASTKRTRSAYVEIALEAQFKKDEAK